MQLASVTRVYKGRSSHEAVVTLETKEGGEKFNIHMPAANASIIALEGHGLNDRCPTYSIFSDCVTALGGAFGSVVITFVDSRPVNAAMAIAQDEKIISWIGGDIIELVAFALHVKLPIFVHSRGASDNTYPPPQSRSTPVPSIFEDAFPDILTTKHKEMHDEANDDVKF